MSTYTYEKDGHVWHSIYPNGIAPEPVEEQEEWQPEARNGVYRAELRAWRTYTPIPLDGSDRAAQAFVDRIVRSAWWKRELGRRAPENVHVFSHGKSGSWAYNGYKKHPRFPKRGYALYINMGRGTNTHSGTPGIADPTALLHELAHVMCYATGAERGHGRAFARYNLLLVRRWLGPEAAAALRDGYKAERVKYSAPRKAA